MGITESKRKAKPFLGPLRDPKSTFKKRSKLFTQRMELPRDLRDVWSWSKTIVGLRRLVVLGSLVGFLLQSSAFLQVYLQYPTVVTMNQTQLPEMAFPAVTLCNNMRIRQSVWFQQDPTLNQGPKESGMDYEKRLETAYEAMNRLDRIRFGDVQERFINRCVFRGRNCSQDVKRFFDPSFGNCFIVFLKSPEGSDWIPLAHGLDHALGNISELKVLMDLRIEEYTAMVSGSKALLGIHSRSVLPNLGHAGFIISPGLAYKLSIRKKVVRMMEPPYASNCVSYLNRYERRMGASMTQENCLDECLWERSMALCNCTHHRLFLLYGGSDCPRDNRKNYSILSCSSEHKSEVLQTCSDKCKMSCLYSEYQILSVDFYKWPTQLWDVNEHEGKNFSNISNARENMIRLKISYLELGEEEIRYKLQYQPLEAFSMLGGYVGLWLGVSLSTLFDCVVALAGKTTGILRSKSTTSIISPRSRHHAVSRKRRRHLDTGNPVLLAL